ncbi:uncharacterized protein V1510DRAFT_430430 [Dipodascopsis tothii]|uniref:uncharacterized protein n=1 Tax=Dipodascopsis tothii TaxID=44089 RepID=UPI0034CEE255
MIPALGPTATTVTRVLVARAASASSATSTACVNGDGNGRCEKPVSSSTETLPIALGVAIPLSVALVIMLILHRRHVRRLKKEDADAMQLDLSHDFDMQPVGGIGGSPYEKRPDYSNSTYLLPMSRDDQPTASRGDSQARSMIYSSHEGPYGIVQTELGPPSAPFPGYGQLPVPRIPSPARLATRTYSPIESPYDLASPVSPSSTRPATAVTAHAAASVESLGLAPAVAPAPAPAAFAPASPFASRAVTPAADSAPPPPTGSKTSSYGSHGELDTSTSTLDFSDDLPADRPVLAAVPPPVPDRASKYYNNQTVAAPLPSPRVRDDMTDTEYEYDDAQSELYETDLGRQPSTHSVESADSAASERAARLKSLYLEYFDDGRPPPPGVPAARRTRREPEPPLPPAAGQIARPERRQLVIDTAAAQARMQRPVEPPKPLEPLAQMPQPHGIGDGDILASSFAPPKRYAGASTTPTSLMAAQVSSPTTEHSFSELRDLPTPYMLRNSSTFTSLDFLPPKKYATSDAGSDAGSLRSPTPRGMMSPPIHAANRVSQIPRNLVPVGKDGADENLKPSWNIRG